MNNHIVVLFKYDVVVSMVIKLINCLCMFINMHTIYTHIINLRVYYTVGYRNSIPIIHDVMMTIRILQYIS